MQLAPAVAAALREVDPGLSFSFRLLADDVAGSVRQERLVARLAATFGGLAMLIASLGVYGTTACSVSRRLREFGIRVALGARPGTLLGLAVGQTLTRTAVGIGLGFGAAAVIARMIGGMLFGIAPLDVSTFLATAVASGAVAALAAAIPAHRASRVDPAVILRRD
jgi:ABC-type antimicrobial peptide transport system permease subunit